jgi:LysR family transcriptional activator of mexEF-oprN operon
MTQMNTVYGRDLDLNLLRVFVAVADAGSVTGAAARLYLTQPAISAALRRLSVAVGAPLFARAGRGLVLTARGQRLLGSARPHLEALLHAALSPAEFDPRTSERSVRLGLSDSSETWLLPRLLRVLAERAPGLSLVVSEVQFRTVAAALAGGSAEIAVTVADELPVGTLRRRLFSGRFVCLFDPRHAAIRRLTLERYLERAHVVVSYNADLRGVVEDSLGIERRVRVAVPSFRSVGTVIDGTELLATVPSMVANELRLMRPHLRIASLPFEIPATPIEMLWMRATDDDDALGFVREQIVAIAAEASHERPPRSTGRGKRKKQK